MFNVRAYYLAESRFVAWLNGQGNKQPDLERVQEGHWTSLIGMHREDLDAYALNLRPLIQAQDGYSIRCLAAIYEALPEDYAEEKSAFAYVRGELNAFFSRETSLQILPGKRLTNWDLLETYLYGGIAHNSQKHFGNFIKLTQSGEFTLFTLAPFLNLMHFLNNSIQKLAILNKVVIERDERVREVEAREGKI